MFLPLCLLIEKFFLINHVPLLHSLFQKEIYLRRSTAKSVLSYFLELLTFTKHYKGGVEFLLLTLQSVGKFDCFSII